MIHEICVAMEFGASAQDIALTRVELGMDLRMPLNFGGADWTFEGGVSAIHSESSGSGLSLADAAPIEGTRGRIDLGLLRVTRQGGEFSLGGYYDGIGQSDYEGYGLRIGYRQNF